MNDRCVVCHTDITAQQQDPNSLHGMRFQASPNLVCRDCHLDHQGPTASLTDLKSEQFAHEFDRLFHCRSPGEAGWICFYLSRLPHNRLHKI